MGVAYQCDKCHQFNAGKPCSVELYQGDESFNYEVCKTCFDEIQKLFQTPPSPAQPEQVNQPVVETPTPVTTNQSTQ